MRLPTLETRAPALAIARFVTQRGAAYSGEINVECDVVTCVECGREQRADERGWKAYLTVDEGEPAEAVVYCPECAAREFGDGESVRP